MNKVFLIGRLTKDPELKYTSTNVPAANFSIAVNRTFENAQGVKETDFINVVVWRKQAENVKKFVFKGSLVAIDGRIQTRNYEDKDGKKVYVTEVVAESVQFLDSKKDNLNRAEIETTNVDSDPYEEFGQNIELSDDDIAF